LSLAVAQVVTEIQLALVAVLVALVVSEHHLELQAAEHLLNLR
jgi:hypothetical protein